MMEVLDCIELTNGCLPQTMADNQFSNYSISRELHSTFEASGIEWPTLRNHIPCKAHIIMLDLGAIRSSLGVKGRTESWVAHDHHRQFGEVRSRDTVMSQRLRNPGDARIHKVSAMTSGLAKIIEKVRISRNFESPQTDLPIAVNACCIEYANTRSSKQAHWLSNSQSTNHSTTYYGCEHTVEFDTGVACACLPITRIHPRVA